MSSVYFAVSVTCGRLDPRSPGVIARTGLWFDRKHHRFQHFYVGGLPSKPALAP
jgi:hypothetical protein